MLDQITVVLGVDANYLPQLAVSCLTWAKFQPWLLDRPWIVFYDYASLTKQAIADAFAPVRNSNAIVLVPWPVHKIKHASQKEKMLAGFVHIPPETVQTEWWMKIDCDAICTGDAPPPNPEWFLRDSIQVKEAGPGPRLEMHPGAPVIVGTPWNYTKPQNQMHVLDDWGDTVGGLKRFPRLGIPYDPGSRAVAHPRFCSWLSFYNTAWSRWAASLCDPYRLPVDSQDGFHWYCAARTGAPVRLVKMKRYGWDNISRLPALKTRVAELLGT